MSITKSNFILTHKDQVSEAIRLIEVLETVCSERISILEDEKKHIDDVIGQWDEGHDHIDEQLRHFDIIKLWAVKYLNQYNQQKEV